MSSALDKRSLLACLQIKTFSLIRREKAIFVCPKVFGDMKIRNKYNNKSSSSDRGEVGKIMTPCYEVFPKFVTL